ncbi:MAG: lytic transglycosylase domain-containing protein [Syntrophorhabdaceae bacterium]|nr:lytic transglycosylase domain-containing protein [Syntrophorhabdaceae bacterium]
MAPLLTNKHDMAFREGWNFLASERFEEAEAVFAGIPPKEHDLGDYVLYFHGMSMTRNRKHIEAVGVMTRLEQQYQGSPMIPYIRHEIGYAAALDNDLLLVRAGLSVSKGKVTGSERKSEELYMSALVAEEDGNMAEASQFHLENIASYTAQPAANLSYERLWGWWNEGLLEPLDLPIAFYAKLGKAIGRALDIERAKEVYDNTLDRFSPSGEYFAMALDYAEMLRKQGMTSEAAALLGKRFESGLAVHKSEMQVLQARVDWKAGRLAEARNKFMAVALGDGNLATRERARYAAAWVALEDGDIAWATEAFGRLRLASNDKVRSESVFRYAYGLYLQKQYDKAIPAFKTGEQDESFGGVETARHRFWRARSLRESGRKKEATRVFAEIAVDPTAGIYALFAVKDLGGDPFQMFNAVSSGETKKCREERDLLWNKVLGASWKPADEEKVRRAARLINLGVVNYAVMEAQRVSSASVKKAVGMADDGAAGLFRYMAGDLRGGIRETVNLQIDPKNPGLLDRIRYPLAPEYVSDCDQSQEGIDPLVLHAIIRQESLFQADAISSAGAVGLMQLMPRTAATTAKSKGLPKPSRADLTRPEINVRLGTYYLAKLLKEFDGDYFRAVSAYNSGESAVRRWWDASGKNDPAAYLERISYQETRLYLRRVIFNLLQYYRVYRPGMYVRYLPSVPVAEQTPSYSEATQSNGSPDGADLATPSTPEAAPSEEPRSPGDGGM